MIQACPTWEFSTRVHDALLKLQVVPSSGRLHLCWIPGRWSAQPERRRCAAQVRRGDHGHGLWLAQEPIICLSWFNLAVAGLPSSPRLPSSVSGIKPSEQSLPYRRSPLHPGLLKV